MKIAIAADHAGYDLKELIKKELASEATWLDQGPSNADRVDYPDFAKKVANLVATKQADLGVLVCGSGIGMCISANKVRGIRAAVVESEQTARLAREHNDANVLCIGARIVDAQKAFTIVRAWLSAKFEGGRHTDRVRKIEP